jgi:hypothetical protein
MLILLLYTVTFLSTPTSSGKIVSSVNRERDGPVQWVRGFTQGSNNPEHTSVVGIDSTLSAAWEQRDWIDRCTPVKGHVDHGQPSSHADALVELVPRPRILSCVFPVQGESGIATSCEYLTPKRPDMCCLLHNHVAWSHGGELKARVKRCLGLIPLGMYILLSFAVVLRSYGSV